VSVAASITTTDLAIYLSIYASVVSTAAGLWALFHGMFRDRARISVYASEKFLVRTPQGHLLIRAEDTLQTMGVTPEQRKEVLHVGVRNRGRRDAKIESVGQFTWKGAALFADLAHKVPFDLPAESSHDLLIGAQGGYEHGQISTRRFFVEDGAQRKHPLRARWRVRVEMVLYREWLALYWALKRRKMRRERLRDRAG
jgi:hypothetical protein